MEFIKLLAVFVVMVVLLLFKKPLSLAMGAGIVSACLLYGIGIGVAAEVLFFSAFSLDTGIVLLSFYVITFLQRMLESRKLLKQAEVSLDNLFQNRRVTTMVAPMFIGLLPSPGAIYICGAIVDDTVGDSLSQEDKTFVTTFFRHIPESSLPTYTSILIALTLTGVSAGMFVLSMLPIMAMLMLLGYLFYIRKIPKKSGRVHDMSKGTAFKKLCHALWTIALAMLIVVVFDLPIYIVMPGVLVLAAFVYRFSLREIGPIFYKAFETKVFFNTLLIMAMRGILEYTGVVDRLPELFATLPIPTDLAFAIIFFVGSLVSGATAIVSLCITVAYSALPDGGVPFMMLLLSFTYAAMQFSPTHICLSMSTEYFKTHMGALIKRTVPIMLIFCGLVLLYYYLLKFIF